MANAGSNGYFVVYCGYTAVANTATATDPMEKNYFILIEIHSQCLNTEVNAKMSEAS